MNIAVLEGYVCNPGDLSWDGFERYGDVTVYERTPRETLCERMKGVEIVIATKVIWDKEALDWSPDLKLIALASTGYNVVDLDEARRRGITVCNVPAYSTPDVAQMTIALMPPAPVSRGAAYAHARRPSDCRATARSRQIAVPRNP